MSVQIFNKYVFLLLFAFALASPAFADESGSSGNAESTCTKNDLRSIKSYNFKARKKIRDYDELVVSAPDMATEGDAKGFTKDINRIIKFFRSDEFASMEKVYSRCDMSIPRPMAKQSFWIPESQRVYYSGI